MELTKVQKERLSDLIDFLIDDMGILIVASPMEDIAKTEGQLIALSVIYPEFFKEQEEFLSNLNRLFEKEKIDHFDVDWNRWVVYNEGIDKK
jgi:hypothetical protein